MIGDDGSGRYGRADNFAVLGTNTGFTIAMTGGSIVGTILGGLLLGIVPTTILTPVLAVLLVLSAVKVWCH